MILREARKRPASWTSLSSQVKHRWATPFLGVAVGVGSLPFEHLAFSGSSRTSWSFSVLAAVIFYFSESGNRIKLRHYQAWQVINTAQGKGGSGGRIEALQELNADKVPLVGVDVSSAFLQGLKLDRANLLRSDFSTADLRGSDLKFADFTNANLRSANLRQSNLEDTSLEDADMKDVDLWDPIFQEPNSAMRI